MVFAVVEGFDQLLEERNAAKVAKVTNARHTQECDEAKVHIERLTHSLAEAQACGHASIIAQLTRERDTAQAAHDNLIAQKESGRGNQALFTQPATAYASVTQQLNAVKDNLTQQLETAKAEIARLVTAAQLAREAIEISTGNIKPILISLFHLCSALFFLILSDLSLGDCA